jgi:hypothetical protein
MTVVIQVMAWESKKNVAGLRMYLFGGGLSDVRSVHLKYCLVRGVVFDGCGLMKEGLLLTHLKQKSTP